MADRGHACSWFSEAGSLQGPVPVTRLWGSQTSSPMSHPTPGSGGHTTWEGTLERSHNTRTKTQFRPENGPALALRALPVAPAPPSPGGPGAPGWGPAHMRILDSTGLRVSLAPCSGEMEVAMLAEEGGTLLSLSWEL